MARLQRAEAVFVPRNGIFPYRLKAHDAGLYRVSETYKRIGGLMV